MLQKCSFLLACLNLITPFDLIAWYQHNKPRLVAESNRMPGEAKAATLTARELLVNKDTKGISLFVGFNSLNDVLEHREQGAIENVTAWNAKDGSKKFEITHKTTVGIFVYAISPDGKMIFSSGTKDGAGIRIWNAQNGEKILADSFDHGGVTRIAFGSSPTEFSTVSVFSIQSWSLDPQKAVLRRGELLKADRGKQERLFSGDLSPDRKRFATISNPRKEISIWDVSNKMEICTLRGYDKFISRVRFTPCGKWLVSVGYDKTTRIWDSKTGQAVKVINHPHGIVAIDISRDGKWLATGGGDQFKYGQVDIWEIPTGKKLLSLSVKDAPKDAATKHVSAVAFNKDGTMLVAATDGAFYVWELKAGNLTEK